MRKFYSIAIDTSAKLKKKVYYCSYKELEWKYQPTQNYRETDGLTMAVDLKKHSLDEARILICEFWSAFSFYYDLRTIIKGGLINEAPMNRYFLPKINCQYIEQREIVSNNLMEDFFYVPIVETEEQKNILSLYRIANSNNDTYSKLLFYWHTLVYPSRKDKDAINYVNENYKKIEWLKDSIDYVMQNQILNHNGKPKELGDYIYYNVRNAIAHIVRGNGYKSLSLDKLDEIRHINEISRILKQICRYKIEYDFGFNFQEPNPHFYYIDPSEC